MTRRKQHRFVHNAESQHVIEAGKPLYTQIKGNWRTRYFNNSNPIVLELACGKGEYTVGLGKTYTDTNFLGVDIKGDRIARGSQAAQDQQLANVGFLRTDIRYLTDFFADGEVDEIWITFPDPQPRDRQEKHRLTYAYFLDKYKQILKPGGLLHLKTDNLQFFEYSLQSLIAGGFVDFIYTNDLYDSPLNNLHLGIKTKYEEIFFNRGFSIKYLQCKSGSPSQDRPAFALLN